MKTKTLLIALYLPQYHRIPENDEFWGKDFTDWVTVKNAKSLYEGHNQPRVPLNHNYYDLSLKENVEWQAQLAHDYGIDGFGVYHYWFNNEKNLLTKPAEILRDDDNIEIGYFFVWDNGNWKRSWSNVSGNDWAPIADGLNQKSGPHILIPYILGSEKDWDNHYHYVITHFKSPRYIKKENKPVFCILNYSKDILKMCQHWDKLAKKDGFDGIFFVFTNPRSNILPKGTVRYSYEPHSSGWKRHLGFWGRVFRKLNLFQPKLLNVNRLDYDEIWQYLLNNAKLHPESNYYHGAYVSYDDSPRRGKNRSIVVDGSTPEKFEKYFSQLMKISKSQSKDFVFLTAWNEWGEGAYLEPDTLNGYQYLEKVKKVVSNY